MSQGPLVKYRAMVASGELNADPAQRLAVEKLQLLWSRLRDYNPSQPKRVGRGLFGWGRETIVQEPVPGLYLYGGVGRGKSMLMDLFHESATIEPRRRVHFHSFMQEMHEQINAARKSGKGDDPVKVVAENVAKSATLLCFDEMQITDITDAMLVGRLFEQLFERGVVVVTTSNRHPDDLYKDGLNRHLFLPFIEIIKKRLDIHKLESPVDHRLARARGEQVYFTPLDAEAEKAIDAAWEKHASGPGEPLEIEVHGRAFTVPRFVRGVARMSFDELCGQPLGAADYLALARKARVLILEGIPALSRANNNEAKRFVTLVDALYEAGILFICSAAAEPDRLYTDGAGAFEFQRTVSRLEEMRSSDWGG